MQIINTLDSLRDIRRQWQQAGQTVAFVPTMGNLHEGHLQLVKEASKNADIVIVSIFVNPMQFGANEDLDAYPRTLDADCEKLSALNVAAVFTPTASQMYPKALEDQTFVEVPRISNIICGASRPGHFRGVATIVCKLFNMVRPDMAFFGEKDYQQLQVIKTMATDLSMGIAIHGVPTERESDGLAMSSRNGYLSAQQRQQAPAVYRVISDIANAIKNGNKNFVGLCINGNQQLQENGLEPDYLMICNGETLASAGPNDTHLVVLVAAFMGKTRLIDNLQIHL